MHTGLDGDAEHVLAFAAAALAVAVAYGHRGIGRIFFALLICAGVLEFVQRFSPGRVPSLQDLVFSVVGILAGLAVFVLSRRLFRPAEKPGAESAPMTEHTR